VAEGDVGPAAIGVVTDFAVRGGGIRTHWLRNIGLTVVALVALLWMWLND
jgi:hypothetical protein